MFFTYFRIFGNFLICIRKFDWKSDTRHSFLEFVAKSEQNFIKHEKKKKEKTNSSNIRRKIAKFDAENEKNRKFIFYSRKNVDDFWLKF